MLLLLDIFSDVQDLVIFVIDDFFSIAVVVVVVVVVVIVALDVAGLASFQPFSNFSRKFS